MATTKTSLKISRFINASPKRVFEAWTRSEHVVKWLCPEDCVIISNKADVREGGAYRSSMKRGNEVYTVMGVYQQLVANEKLVFTHQWTDEGSPETLVTVELKNKSGGTNLTLSQIGFDDLSVAKGHEKGWESALNNLTKYLGGRTTQ